MSASELAARLFIRSTLYIRVLAEVGLGVVLGVVLLLLPALSASAAAGSYRWANTHAFDGSVKVGWCAGGTKTLSERTARVHVWPASCA